MNSLKGEYYYISPEYQEQFLAIIHQVMPESLDMTITPDLAPEQRPEFKGPGQ